MTTGRSLLSQRVFSFSRGGLSFEDTSVPARDSCVTAFLPSLSVIPLVQHSGGRAYPVVTVGEVVREGMLIGRGRGPGSANIHASVPGRVMKMVSWRTAGGQILEGIVIRMEGSFEKTGKRPEYFPWEGMFPYDIQRTISDAGIVEMEGRGKPVSDIISSFRSASEPVTLVVRCVFDDPWLASDYVLSMERSAAVAEGAAITSRTSRVSRIIYAVSHREKKLGEEFLKTGDRWGIPVSLVSVGSRYPQRNRRELELVLRNFGKSEGLELGSMIMLGPATLAAVYDAVKLRKPVLERYISVGGSAVKKPQVMKVRLGTRFGDLFNECGGFKAPPKKIAVGSPLLGRTIVSLDEPVTKTSNAVFALLEDYRRPGSGAQECCISCGECRSVCPVGLDPEELYKRTLGYGMPGPGRPSTGAPECHGCGCCELVCPSRLPLRSRISASALRGN